MMHMDMMRRVMIGQDLIRKDILVTASTKTDTIEPGTT